jgi:FixJ family two-component response regulator
MSESTGIVFVIDDDVSIRCGLAALLRSVGLRAELFGSASEFLSRKPSETPACITLDIWLPGMSGLDLQRQLTKAQINIPLIFLTGHSDVAMSVQAMKAGAVDFLTKPFRDEELLDAIVHAIDRDGRRRQREAETATLHKHFGTLNQRERDVLKWVVSGLLNKQVAAEIGTTEATVKFYRAQLMRKMKAESLAGLVRMSIDLGLSVNTSGLPMLRTQWCRRQRNRRRGDLSAEPLATGLPSPSLSPRSLEDERI